MKVCKTVEQICTIISHYQSGLNSLICGRASVDDDRMGSSKSAATSGKSSCVQKVAELAETWAFLLRMITF